jgi:hypothetical protein
MYFRLVYMQNKILFSLFLSLTLTSFINVCLAQDKITLTGYFLDESSFSAIQLANISIRPSGTKYISNRKGLFRIIISRTDSVYISAIGFKSKAFDANEIIPQNTDDTIRIYLRPTVYKLKDVNVVYSNRKRDSIARLAAEILKTDPLLNNYDRVINRPKGGIMNPLSAMYEAWSKEGQDMRKFEDFLHYTEQQRAIDKRYNKKIVKQLTDIEEEDLDDFMLFCKMDRMFILTAQEYDLVEEIKKYGDKFKTQKLRESTKLR